MKCKCGNEIDIKMGSKLLSRGCKVLTAVTIVVTAECEKCNLIFQVPIRSSGLSVKRE